jgi:hypothetical protein
MAKKVQLKAKARTESGRGAVKRLRDGGVVPGVIYGAHTKPLHVAVRVKNWGKCCTMRPARTCWWTCKWTRGHDEEPPRVDPGSPASSL